jgi:hypothetical protein
MAAAEAWDMVDVKHGGARKKQAGKISILNGSKRDHLGGMFGCNGKYVEQARFVIENDSPRARATQGG